MSSKINEQCFLNSYRAKIVSYINNATDRDVFYLFNKMNYLVSIDMAMLTVFAQMFVFMNLSEIKMVFVMF